MVYFQQSPVQFCWVEPTLGSFRRVYAMIVVRYRQFTAYLFYGLTLLVVKSVSCVQPKIQLIIWSQGEVGSYAIGQVSWRPKQYDCNQISKCKALTYCAASVSQWIFSQGDCCISLQKPNWNITSLLILFACIFLDTIHLQKLSTRCPWYWLSRDI